MQSHASTSRLQIRPPAQLSIQQTCSDPGSMVDDLISQLPNEILVLILARIPTREAFRTSILSKKWRDVYKFVPAISISCSCNRPGKFYSCDSKMITDGLHRFSQLHSSFIHSLEYRCCLNESYETIFEHCICSLGKGIEKLLLQFSSYRSVDFSFPLRLLSNMPSLKYFQLEYCSLQPNLNTHFNSLTSLRLSEVIAPPGSLECILSNCLSLCSLLIDDCDLPSNLSLRSSSHHLKCILINDFRGIEEIKLHASNLITFEFYGRETVDIILDYVPHLQKVSLSLYSNTMTYCWTLVKDLPHLKSLHLDIFYDIARDSIIPVGIHMFSNLQRLDLNARGQINLFLVAPLLHNCPLLQEFHLATREPVISRAHLSAGPQLEKHVVHPQLKKVDISGYVGTEHQYRFVAYLLKSCVELRQMYISLYCDLYSGFGEWEVQEFCPRKEKNMGPLYGHIKQLKHHAVSKTVQVIFQKLPRITKSKQFIEDGVWFDHFLE